MTAGIQLGRRRPAAARRRAWRIAVGGAGASLRKDEMNVIGGCHITGKRCSNRADLFVAGEQKECRRATVALDADRVESGSGCASSRCPCGGTDPQECRFGSISGPSALVLSSHGSSSRRNSRVSESSGR